MAVPSVSRIRSRRVVGSKNSSITARNSGTTCRIERGGMRLEGGGIKAVVVTVTVDVFGVTPSVVATEAGEGVHVPSVSAGTLAQVRSTCEVNPPTGVTVTVKLTEEPFFTVAVPGAVTVKSGAVFVPVPVKEIVWGLVLSPSVKTRFAVSTPATVGLNVTLTVQEASAAMLTPHVLAETA